MDQDMKDQALLTRNFLSHEIDLSRLLLAPSLEVVSPNSALYTVTLSPEKSRSERRFRLNFQGEEGTALVDAFSSGPSTNISARSVPLPTMDDRLQGGRRLVSFHALKAS